MNEPTITSLHIGRIVKFADGREVRITGIEMTPGNERVRVTRYDAARGVNVTTWMKFVTFLKKQVWYAE